MGRSERAAGAGSPASTSSNPPRSYPDLRAGGNPTPSWPVPGGACPRSSQSPAVDVDLPALEQPDAYRALIDVALACLELLHDDAPLRLGLPELGRALERLDAILPEEAPRG
jgi:hypothetical protein